MFSASLDGTIRAFDLIRYRNFRTFTSPESTQFSCLAVDPSGDIVGKYKTYKISILYLFTLNDILFSWRKFRWI